MINTESKPILTAVYTHPNFGMFPAKNLTVGEAYVVTEVDMGSWSTDISLDGYSEVFNSVQFDFFENGEPVDIYSMPRYNPYLRMMAR